MRIAAPLVLLALLLAGCATPDAAPGSGATPTGADGKGPDWSFTAIDGATYSRDEPPANATVLFFMATWCGSCRSKAPVLASVQDEYSAADVRILSVDFDPTETKADIDAWKERYRQDWPHGIDEERTVQRALDVRIQSSVVVLDADGRVVEHFGYGQVTDQSLRGAIDAALVQ